MGDEDVLERVARSHKKACVGRKSRDGILAIDDFCHWVLKSERSVASADGNR